jgi:glucoamylase
VAALTTSLPERIGEDRNYDYRLAWVRDASLSLAMLARLGRIDEVQRYLDWLWELSVDAHYVAGKVMSWDHLVWPHDQVEAAGATLASGDAASARETLFYLMCTQEADGCWPQNMWLDGTPYWTGVPADETALVILLATQITAFLAGADFAEAAGERELAGYLRETADSWNAQIEDWTYVRDTDLAQRVGVDGYYVRLAPPEVLEHGSPGNCTIFLKNRSGPGTFPASDIVSPDALALVRFGLRAANDPRIVNTVKVIDATLKTETATGPVWHR